MSDLDDLLGDWKAKRDVRTTMGFSTVTIPAGSVVAVKQVSQKTRKVLVQAGPQFIGWKHKNFLDLFEPLSA